MISHEPRRIGYTDANTFYLGALEISLISLPPSIRHITAGGLKICTNAAAEITLPYFSIFSWHPLRRIVSSYTNLYVPCNFHFHYVRLVEKIFPNRINRYPIHIQQKLKLSRYMASYDSDIGNNSSFYTANLSSSSSGTTTSSLIMLAYFSPTCAPACKNSSTTAGNFP